MARREFTTDTDGVRLGGWVEGRGKRVLLLHGGPGLSVNLVEDLVDELGDGYEGAAYQQRGLPPSQEEGPFTVEDHVSDVRRVLETLQWDRVVVVGHSWGGHLALHAASVLADRVAGVLAVDPLGGVGDGGWAEFDEEMYARTPQAVRAEAEELDARAMRGEGPEDAAVEGLRLMWPAYFPSWGAAPPMPPLRLSVPCYSETLESLMGELPRLEAALPTIRVPVGFVVGARSPMPTTASAETAARIPTAWVEAVAGAGHFPWLDAPGSVRSALERLTRA